MNTPETPHERYEMLLMKAVDGVLDDAERRELEQHLDVCPRCRAELSDFQLIKETTDALTARILGDAELEAPRPGGGARVVLSASFLLLAVGAALLLGFAAYSLFTDAAVPLVVKIGAGAGGAGLLALTIHVLRLRLRAAGRDPYEEIDQ